MSKGAVFGTEKGQKQGPDWAFPGKFINNLCTVFGRKKWSSDDNKKRMGALRKWMKKEGEILLSLLQAAVSGAGAELSGPAQADVDWYAVMRLAEQQRVAAVSYDGLTISNVVVDEQTRLAWCGMVASTEMAYSNHLQAIGDLATLLSSEGGLNIGVLKGLGCSTLYPTPNHRAPGDIDLFLWRREDKRVRCCQQEGDFLVHKHLDIPIDNTHAHHTVFYLNNIMVENHYNFINIEDLRSSRRVEQRLIELSQGEWRTFRLKKGNGSGAAIFLPPVDFDTLFLSRHMARHFSGSNTILRQLLDWALFVRRFHNEIDWESAVKDWKAFAMLPFVKCINTICLDTILKGETNDLFHGVTSDDKVLCDRILNEIIEPKMALGQTKGRETRPAFRLRRFLSNGWKRKITYEESTPEAFVSIGWSHLKRKDFN